jgi:acyl-CoA synthetase (NDP forming)
MHEIITDLNSGPVALISQSGGLALNLLFLGPEFGINFSKVISYGNAMTIDADSFMEYLAKDPETQIVCMYLEGVKNSRRLLEQVRETCVSKPVIILKSGLSESGARAASSHTGSMAGDKKMWDAFFRQTGAVQVQTIEEMAETALCFLKLKKPLTRVQSAVLGIGGGTTVNNGDTCTREGIDVPKLSDQSIDELSKFIDLTNQGISNPMDIPGVIFNFDALTKTLDVLNKDPKIDCVILTLLARMFSGPMEPMLPHFTTFLNKYAQEHPDSKPIVVSFSEEVYLSWLEKCVGEFRKAGILAFPSLAGACGALKRFAGYHKSVK